jgi:hypothetical protein
VARGEEAEGRGSGGGEERWGVWWEVRRNKKMSGQVIVINQILFIIIDGIKRRQESRNDGPTQLEEGQNRRRQGL